MAIEKVTVYRPVCDGCGEMEVFTGGEMSWIAGDTEEEVVKIVEMADGRVCEDGKVLCSACIDEEGERCPEDD